MLSLCTHVRDSFQNVKYDSVSPTNFFFFFTKRYPNTSEETEERSLRDIFFFFFIRYVTMILLLLEYKHDYLPPNQTRTSIVTFHTIRQNFIIFLSSLASLKPFDMCELYFCVSAKYNIGCILCYCTRILIIMITMIIYFTKCTVGNHQNKLAG